MNSKEIIDNAIDFLVNGDKSHLCRKGHSYRVDLKRTEMTENRENYIFVRKWTCIKCGRHMEN